MRFAVLLIIWISSFASQAQNQQDAVVADTVAVESEEMKDMDRKEDKNSPQNQSKKLKATSAGAYKEAELRESPAADEVAPSTSMPEGGGAEMNSHIYFQNSSSFEISRSEATIQRTQRSPSEGQQLEMNNAVDYFEQTAPESFEYNYYRYAAGNYNTSLVSNLSVAEELRPDNSDVQTQFAAYHIIMGNQTEAIDYLDQLVVSGRLSQGVLDYSEDILRSTPENGTLLTHGFDDTYGSYYMQNSKGVRTDVELVSLDFMQSEEYCDRLKSKNYQIPDNTLVNVDYFSSFCALNSGKKIAVSMTTPKEYIQPQMSNFYATGLVFEYHPEPFSNLARNEMLWDNGLSKKVLIAPADDKARRLSSNYLPMLFLLRKAYSEQGRTKELQEIDQELDKVGAQSDKYEKVQSLKKAYK